jgi:hypothetical protein
LIPAGEMIWHPRHALADPLGHQRLDARLGIALGARCGLGRVSSSKN